MRKETARKPKPDFSEPVLPSGAGAGGATGAAGAAAGAGAASVAPQQGAEAAQHAGAAEQQSEWQQCFLACFAFRRAKRPTRPWQQSVEQQALAEQQLGVTLQQSDEHEQPEQPLRWWPALAELASPTRAKPTMAAKAATQRTKARFIETSSRIQYRRNP